MEVYNFKVALDHDKRIYRNIEILSNQTLEDLHDIIFNSFDRYDEHLYSFYLTKRSVKNRHSRYKAPEYTDPTYFEDDFNAEFGMQKYNASEVHIGTLGLKVKDKLYYLFDFGDCWWHEITLLSVYQVDNNKDYPKIVKKSGKSPGQYPDDDC